MRQTVRRASRFSGTATVPGDKSISHRALILGALGEGRVELANLGPGADVRSTAAVLRALGVLVEADAVTGVGLAGLRGPAGVLACGNSGTTMRLLAGVLAGAGIPAVLDGDESLRRRPMGRVLAPLRAMGARCQGAPARGDERAPLRFPGGARLAGVRHDLPIASAQVKSCLLLAGLFADGITRVREPHPSRDHTERLLAAAGVPLARDPDGALAVRRPDRPLRLPSRLEIPGDPSSAAFLAAAAVLVPGGAIEIPGVLANPTRTGFFGALARMGARVEFRRGPERAGEPTGTLVARHGPLRGILVGASEVPALIDEVPLLAVMATQAEGRTELRGAGELRVKESDRLARIAAGLGAMGAHVEELADGLAIHGPTPLSGAVLDAASDHRIAMALAVAGLVADGETVLDGAEWADVSWPGFFALLGTLSGAPGA
jgi:3-phosphoshikimate 1-carboxyvinyltransferase